MFFRDCTRSADFIRLKKFNPNRSICIRPSLNSVSHWIIELPSDASRWNCFESGHVDVILLVTSIFPF
ncbi:hypothetical protein M5689_020796 [Euphorbia peplus]|nr:hypothetical protein M5689_020796 [Euphorbia peplus]